MADENPIDPRLYATSLPPAQAQSFAPAPQHSASQPYYLPSPTQHHAPPLSAPLGSSLDPALEQTSPAGPATVHDDDEQDDDGDHDGYVLLERPQRVFCRLIHSEYTPPLGLQSRQATSSAHERVIRVAD